MKRRLLSGLAGALILVSSLNLNLVSYAENVTVIESQSENLTDDKEEDKEVVIDAENDKEKTLIDEKKDEIKDTSLEDEKSEDVDEKEEEETQEKTGLELDKKIAAVGANIANLFLMATTTQTSSGTGTLKDKDNIKLVKKITLLKNGTELKGDGTDVVQTGDIITVRYDFTSPLLIVPDKEEFSSFDYDVIAEREYEIPGIPSYCVRPNGDEILVKKGSLEFGKAKILNDGTASLLVNSFDEPVNAEEAFFQYDVELNFDGIDNGGNESFEIKIGESSFTVKVGDFMPQPPKVEKSASSVDSNGDITWTVTVTNNKKPIEYDGGYSFTDTFSDGQDYVKDSFEVTEDGDKKTAPDVTVNGKSISWSYENNKANSVTVFTYKTHVDLLALTKDVNANKTVEKSLSNKITVKGKNETYGDLSKDASTTATASKAIEEWTAKSGGEVDHATGKATWTVTVKNNGFTLKNVVLYDRIDADVDIKISDISVKNKKNGTVGHSFVEGTNGKPNEFHFDGLMAGDEEYTVTYTTTIKDIQTFLKTNHKKPKNTAWVTYEYDGAGPDPVKVTGPSVGKDFGKLEGNAAIEKGSAGIDTVNHTMKWKITVNKSAQPLTGVKVTDTLPEGHDYLSIESITLGGSAYTLDTSKITTGTDENGKSTVTFDFGDDLKDKAAEIILVTKLKDSESSVWAGNASKEYTNTSTLFYDGNTEGITVSAKQTYRSNVISKAASSYNYADHTIKYTLTVNSNNMKMNDVNVTDVLDPKLQLQGDFNITSGTCTGYKNNTSGNNIALHFDTVDTKLVIEFTVKVLDGEHFNSNGTIKIDNSVTLVSKEYDKEVTAKLPSPTAINNKVLEKTGAKGADGTVNYTVKINQAGQKLYTGSITKVWVKDTIGASFIYNKDSVKLYTGKVASNGTITYEPSDEITGITMTVTPDGDRSVLEVVIPKDKDDSALVLVYSADVADLKAEDLSNNAQLMGYGEASKNTGEKNFNKNDFNGVSFSKFTYLTINIKEGSALDGAKFELRDPVTGEVIATKVVKNGQITIAGKLEKGKEYILVETEAPDGYEISDELKNGVTVKVDKEGMANAKVVNVEHSKPGNGTGTGSGTGPVTLPGRGQGSGSGSGTGTGSGSGSGSGEGTGSGSGSSSGSGSGSGNSADNSSSSSNDQNSDSSATVNLTVNNSLAKDSTGGSLTLDDDVPAVLGARRSLAKTGGFVGTVLAYVLGIMCVVAGLILINRDRKHHE